MSDAIVLSEQDRSLLRLIQKNASMSRQDLAEAAGMSQTTLWRRMNDLESAGLIRGSVTLLDPEKAGVPVCFIVLVNMVDHEERTLAAFERVIEATPEIMECYSVTGQYDYMLIIRTESVNSFRDLQRSRLLNHPSVANASSSVSLERLKYSTELPI